MRVEAEMNRPRPEDGHDQAFEGDSQNKRWWYDMSRDRKVLNPPPRLRHQGSSQIGCPWYNKGRRQGNASGRISGVFTIRVPVV